MHHGIVDVFAYQEAVLIEAVFGFALLAVIWAGFRRWVGYKEKLIQLTAEREARHGVEIERVEERLKAIEQIVMTAGGQSPAQIETITAPPIPK